MKFKHLKRWSAILALCAATAIIIPSCSKDNDEPPSGNGTENPVNPNDKVDDPAGTITLSMRIDGKDQSTINDHLKVNDELNFVVINDWYDNQSYIASVGDVRGLGNVATIPTLGWAKKMKASPGQGYVFYDGHDKKFYRIYVTEYLHAAGSDAILGVTVKYHTPFGGLDQTLTTKTSALTFDADGGEQTIIFDNSSITDFTVECDQPWVTVEKASSSQYSFLPNGIHILIEPSSTSDARKATITLRTTFDKTTKITVSQTGITPYLEIDGTEFTFDQWGGNTYVPVATNLGISEIAVTGCPNWMEAYLVDYTYYLRKKAAEARWIGDKPVKMARGSDGVAKSYSLCVYASENDGSERQATLSISHASIKHSLKVVQKGISYYITSTGDNSMVIKPQGTQGEWRSFSFMSNIPIDDLKVSCAADWINDVTLNADRNNRFTVNFKVDENTTGKRREATITASSDLTQETYIFTVIQLAYTLSVSTGTLYLDKNSNYRTLTISTNAATLPTPKASVDWISFSTNGSQLTIYTTATTEDRVGYVTFAGYPDQKIEVHQSKYAVGDMYDENGVKGLVACMEADGKNFIVYTGDGNDYKSLGNFQWSTQNVQIGANDSDNGEKNMAVVKSIPNWQDNYPAFAAVDALNTDGVTGWYLPALNECKLFTINLWKWTSTEYYESRAYAIYNSSRHDICTKQDKCVVYAVHRFTF